MMNSIQQFKQAMAHRLGKDTPQVIHGDGKVHTFMVKGKEWHYILGVKKEKEEDGYEVKETEEAAGHFGTLAGAEEDYDFETNGADKIRLGVYGKSNISYSLRDLAQSMWWKFIGTRRRELSKRVCSGWQKLEVHPDGQHRKLGEALYLPVRTWEGEVLGMVRTFPDFQIIGGSGFSSTFVLLGEIPKKPERIVIAYEWHDAVEIHKVTGLPVLFAFAFSSACHLASDLTFHYEGEGEGEEGKAALLPPEETKIIVVDDPTRLSTRRWIAYPDGVETRESYQDLMNLAEDSRVMALDQILKNKFDGDDTAFDFLDEPNLGYVLETGADIVASTEDISFLVPDLIPSQTLIEMHATPGEGKTTLALQALGAVASGGVFLGTKAEKRPVVVCDYENSPPALKALIRRIEGADQINFLEDPPQLDQPDWIRLKIIARNLGNPVFLIDTLASACTSCDIGSNADLAPVMRRMLELRNMGATILLLNHTLKRDPSKFIGAQVVISQSDHVVSLTPNSGGSYRLGTSGKTRFGHFEKTIKFDLDRKLFVPAGNPDQEAIDSILFALDLQSPASVQQISAVTHIVEKKLRTLLDRYEGHHWTSDRGSKNSKIYFPA